ncbi:MAG TPA: DUF6492 family protein [Pyrinomonadaceae bacterium]
MTNKAFIPVDVLMCVGSKDVNYLMPYSLKSCISNFTLLNDVVIVTSVKREVLNILDQHKIRSRSGSITVLDDEEVVPASLMDFPPWCRQQFIRLHADEICATPVVACLSADTITYKPVTREHLFTGSTPNLFYNRYPNTSKHLDYERGRVENIARILQVRPENSWTLGDFIMDLTLFESKRLRQLRAYLKTLYGENPFHAILPRDCEDMQQKATFGEWTLYAVFLLDVLKIKMPIRNSRNKFIAQVHSAKEFAAFHFDAHVVHFVDKSFDVPQILARYKANVAEQQASGY